MSLSAATPTKEAQSRTAGKFTDAGPSMKIAAAVCRLGRIVPPAPPAASNRGLVQRHDAERHAGGGHGGEAGVAAIRDSRRHGPGNSPMVAPR